METLKMLFFEKLRESLTDSGYIQKDIDEMETDFHEYMLTHRKVRKEKVYYNEEDVRSLLPENKFVIYIERFEKIFNIY